MLGVVDGAGSRARYDRTQARSPSPARGRTYARGRTFTVLCVCRPVQSYVAANLPVEPTTTFCITYVTYIDGNEGARPCVNRCVHNCLVSRHIGGRRCRFHTAARKEMRIVDFPYKFLDRLRRPISGPNTSSTEGCHNGKYGALSAVLGFSLKESLQTRKVIRTAR